METIRLDEFVEAALTQLALGISNAQKSLADHCVSVNPPAQVHANERSLSDWVVIRGSSVPTQAVKFDIAATAIAGKGTEGKIGVIAGMVGLASKGHSHSENSNITRIQFDVRIAFPPGELRDDRKP